MNATILLACLISAAVGAAPGEVSVVQTNEHSEIGFDKVPWLRTMTPTFDPKNSEPTYKVFTHIMDFAGKEPITKGAGGKFTHHRGLFIGWKDTLVGDQDYDTWHMSNSIQKHVGWLDFIGTDGKALQQEKIDWCNLEGKTFIQEIRRISATPAEGESRQFDFQSELTSTAGKIQLKGDLQHAGMQVRLAQEVAEHEDSTNYILPAGSVSGEDDKVTGAWWACCSAEVGGKRYWVLHMTHPSTCAETPVYSIRKYARFGAFWEPTLEEGKPQTYSFRVVVSERELDVAECQKRYDAYAASSVSMGK